MPPKSAMFETIIHDHIPTFQRHWMWISRDLHDENYTLEIFGRMFSVLQKIRYRHTLCPGGIVQQKAEHILYNIHVGNA